MSRFVHLVPFGIVVEEMKRCFVVVGIPCFVQRNERTGIKYGVGAGNDDQLLTVESGWDDCVILCESNKDKGLKAKQYDGSFYHVAIKVNDLYCYYKRLNLWMKQSGNDMLRG